MNEFNQWSMACKCLENELISYGKGKDKVLKEQAIIMEYLNEGGYEPVEVMQFYYHSMRKEVEKHYGIDLS